MGRKSESKEDLYRKALISAADDDYASPVAREMAYRILFRMIGEEEREKEKERKRNEGEIG